MSERPADGSVIVFAGPALSGCTLPAGFELWPPAQRGDVLRALSHRPAALVLLDGFYYSVPAVTHKELLYALESGVPVVGAASMGALRAVELAPFGMIGVGRVFELFRDGILDGDDEVAILHGGAEHGYRPLTLALVEVRCALESVLARRGLPAAAGEGLLAALKVLPFTQRDAGTLRRLSSGHWGEDGVELADEVLTLLACEGIKRSDARAALDRAERLVSPRSEEASSTPPRRPLITTFVNHFREWYLQAEGEREHEPSYLRAWQMAQLFHPRAEAFVRAVRQRFLLASAAEAVGLEAAGPKGEYPALSLPPAEWLQEQHTEGLAVAALERLGSLEAAAAVLAPRFGLPVRGALESLLALLERQNDLLPPWRLTRAFLTTSAWPAARDLAASAGQVARAFRAWAGGARLSEAEVRRVAAAIFECPLEEVSVRAARRGLAAAGATATEAPGGLREAVEEVAAAERLRDPVNDYPQLRRRLRESLLELPALPHQPLARAR